MPELKLLTIPCSNDAKEAIMAELKKSEQPFRSIKPGNIFIHVSGKNYNLYAKLGWECHSQTDHRGREYNAQEMCNGSSTAQMHLFKQETLVRPVTLEIAAHWTLSRLVQSN